MKDRVKPGGTFDFRPGISSDTGVHPGWKGIMPDVDPSSLPSNNLAMALNVRHEGGAIRGRWGLKQVADFGEEVTWLGTHHMQSNSSRLWVLAPTGARGVMTYWHNPDYNPVWGASREFRTASIYGAYSGLGSFAGSMHLFTGNVLHKLDPDPASTGGGKLGSTMNGLGWSLQEFGSHLYIGIQTAWDGVSLLSTGGTTSSSVTNTCVWRDTYLVGLELSGSVYTYGSIAGGWFSDSLPAAYNTYGKNSMVEFRDVIYVASGDTDIWAIIPGVSATVVHSCPVGSWVTGVCVMGDMLFYAYTTTDGVNLTSFIGIHEPDSNDWDDVYVDLNAKMAVDEPNLPVVTALLSYRNRLYVGYGATLGQPAGIATHEETSLPSGTWYKVLTTGPVVGMRVGS